MPKRILCKFFAHGACLKGELCDFSHDWKAPPDNICTFYPKGICAYGSRCRYEHVKLSRSQSSSPSLEDVCHIDDHISNNTSVTTSEHSSVTTSEHSTPPIKSTLKEKSGHQFVREDDCDVRHFINVDPVNQPICSFAAVGDCPRGEKCPHIHCDKCSICGKRCLHPFRPQEREQHVKICEKRQRHLEAIRKSQEIECSVCLEHVLSKPTLGERKFGILSECDHPFCISCIRNWRSSSPASGLDVNSALRACPICRKLSYFVVPSVIWYWSKEEKKDIINRYKAKLSSIDCKYFDFGNGTCPFGTSCFYKHAFNDGHVDEVVLRHLAPEDGNPVIAKNIRLSELLRNLQIR